MFALVLSLNSSQECDPYVGAFTKSIHHLFLWFIGKGLEKNVFVTRKPICCLK